MAEERGGFNPANFYLGVVELFGIVVPGAIFSFLVYRFAFQEPSSSLSQVPDVGKIFGFVIFSYVIGHLLAALGYFLMNPLFWWYYKSGRKGAVSLRGLAARAKSTLDLFVQFGERPDDEFRWTIAYINLCSAQASTRLDTLEADCKLFRNLTPTLFLILSSIQTGSRIFVAMGVGVLIVVAGLRYLALQAKLMTSAYEFLILLLSKAREAPGLREAAPKA